MRNVLKKKQTGLYFPKHYHPCTDIDSYRSEDTQMTYDSYTNWSQLISWRPIPLCEMLKQLHSDSTYQVILRHLNSVSSLGVLKDAFVFTTHFIKLENYDL